MIQIVLYYVLTLLFFCQISIGQERDNKFKIADLDKGLKHSMINRFASSFEAKSSLVKLGGRDFNFSGSQYNMLGNFYHGMNSFDSNIKTLSFKGNITVSQWNSDSFTFRNLDLSEIMPLDTMYHMLEIKKNIFKTFGQFYDNKASLVIKDNILQFSQITMSRNVGEVIFYGNKVLTGTSLKIDSRKNPEIGLSNYNTLIDDKGKEKTVFQRNTIINSYSDTVNYIELKNYGFSSNKYEFEKATLTGEYSYNFICDSISKTRVIFKTSTFKERAYLFIKNVDTVSFTECRFANSSAMFIANKRLVLLIKNTNLDNLHFDFVPGMVLGIQKELSFDQNTLIFASLLRKFINEGRTESEMYLNIQFKQYKYSHDRIQGVILNFVDWAWWNYGYAKDRIISITIGALLFFSIINLIYTRSMLNFYPILSLPTIPSSSKTRRSLNQVAIMFLFTIFIFFSLKVDFEKIKTDRTRLMIYFFIQYTFGLICLLFLFGAIFKF